MNALIAGARPDVEQRSHTLLDAGSALLAVLVLLSVAVVWLFVLHQRHKRSLLGDSREPGGAPGPDLTDAERRDRLALRLERLEQRLREAHGGDRDSSADPSPHGRGSPDEGMS